MSIWLNSAANAMAPYREGANTYSTPARPLDSKTEEQRLGNSESGHEDSQTTQDSATSTAHLSPESSNNTTGFGAGSEGLKKEVRGISGQFNAPTEAEIESSKKHKGWRGKWQKLREYQRPDKP